MFTENSLYGNGTKNWKIQHKYLGYSPEDHLAETLFNRPRQNVTENHG